MLKKMWYVYTVYEEKSFSRRLSDCSSRSRRSAHGEEVESDYDITIFDRNHNADLADAGRRILYLRGKEDPEAGRRHAAAFPRVLQGAQRQCDVWRRELFLCQYALGIIRQFQSEYPDIHIGWQELRNDELASQILQKKIDFAFEVDKIETDGITSLKFGSEELILTVPPPL